MIPCGHCKRLFTPKRRTMRFCKAQCRNAAHRDYLRNYREANRDRINKTIRAWSKKNRKRHLTIIRNYRRRNPHKMREWNITSKYGLTAAEVLALGPTCHICGTPWTVEKGPAQRQIDHDHETGAARGVLCMRCNIGLGYFREDSMLLLRAIEYLAKHAAVPRREQEA